MIRRFEESVCCTSSVRQVAPPDNANNDNNKSLSLSLYIYISVVRQRFHNDNDNDNNNNNSNNHIITSLYSYFFGAKPARTTRVRVRGHDSR